MRSSTLIRPLVGLFSILGVATCSPATSPDDEADIVGPRLSRVRDCSGPATSLPPELAGRVPPSSVSGLADDRYATLARSVPGGFAGILYDGGTPVLLLTDPSQAAAAKAALVSELPNFDVANAQVRAARWNFAQLVEWYSFLAPTADDVQGVTMSDKDEGVNRIVYGVEDSHARDRLIERLMALDVMPCDLVQVEIRDAVVPVRR